jgi:hypothetical protein
MTTMTMTLGLVMVFRAVAVMMVIPAVLEGK